MKYKLINLNNFVQEKEIECSESELDNEVTEFALEIHTHPENIEIEALNENNEWVGLW